jgi:TrmH family RNA methyltransferase
MISKQQAKFIKSLQFKKYRQKAKSFIVEGAKSVLELAASDLRTTMIVGTADFFHTHGAGLGDSDIQMVEVGEKELRALGTFESNAHALAVAHMPDVQPLVLQPDDVMLGLLDVRDPGNLGTIIRTADWYGVRKILLSPGCVDFYNPKVVNATMGSFTRVVPYFDALPAAQSERQWRVYAADMHGTSIYDVQFRTPALILMGNESRGFSEAEESLVHDRITIPRYGAAESLNVAMACGIILDNLRRRQQGG